MLVTSPPEENTTIQGSTERCGNVPKWELQLRPERGQRGGQPGGQAGRAPRPRAWEPVFWVPSPLL